VLAGFIASIECQIWALLWAFAAATSAATTDGVKVPHQATVVAKPLRWTATTALAFQASVPVAASPHAPTAQVQRLANGFPVRIIAVEQGLEPVVRAH
jgi:hypothetical protein